MSGEVGLKTVVENNPRCDREDMSHAQRNYELRNYRADSITSRPRPQAAGIRPDPLRSSLRELQGLLRSRAYGLPDLRLQRSHSTGNRMHRSQVDAVEVRPSVVRIPGPSRFAGAEQDVSRNLNPETSNHAREHELRGDGLFWPKRTGAQNARRDVKGRLPKNARNTGEFMYTGRTIEDLLELVSELVERQGGVVFVEPTITVSPKQNLWNQGELNSQSARDQTA